jgi:signal transduction histidine kinase
LQIETLDAEEQLLMAYERCFAAAADRLRLPPPRSEPVLLFRADSQRLQQCLKALISNAMLYSPGLVQLQAEWRIDQVVLHVLDHGPGIPEAEREQVFRRFARGAMAGPTRGVGLGLALVDQLLQAMGGALSIRDAPGGGADVQLQFRVVSHPPAP